MGQISVTEFYLLLLGTGADLCLSFVSSVVLLITFLGYQVAVSIICLYFVCIYICMYSERIYIENSLRLFVL